MIQSVKVQREVQVQEYFVLRAISDTGTCKKVIREKEFERLPTITETAAFLVETGADFVSIARNFRLWNDLPFS